MEFKDVKILSSFYLSISLNISLTLAFTHPTLKLMHEKITIHATETAKIMPLTIYWIFTNFVIPMIAYLYF